jgi:hypothetical protein
VVYRKSVPPLRVSLWEAKKAPAACGHAPSANPLILVIAGDHSGPLKSLFSLDSSGVRDVGVAGSNPVDPIISSRVPLEVLQR